MLFPTIFSWKQTRRQQCSKPQGPHSLFSCHSFSLYTAEVWKAPWIIKHLPSNGNTVSVWFAWSYCRYFIATVIGRPLLYPGSTKLLQTGIGMFSNPEDTYQRHNWFIGIRASKVVQVRILLWFLSCSESNDIWHARSSDVKNVPIFSWSREKSLWQMCLKRPPPPPSPCQISVDSEWLQNHDKIRIHSCTAPLQCYYEHWTVYILHSLDWIGNSNIAGRIG